MNELKTPLGLKKTASRLGMAVFVMMMVQQIVSGVAGALLGMFMPEFLQQPYGIWLLSYVPLYLIAVPFFFVIAKTAPSTDTDKEKIKMPLNTFIKWWFISMAAMWVFNLISNIINLGIGALKGSAVVNPIAQIAFSSGFIYNIIFGVIIAPIGEELMFRYMFFKKLSGYGDKVYIFVSSLCFAMMHGNLSQLLYAFVLGAIFAYIMARTRNVKYCIAMHMIINAYGMVLAPLALNSPIILALLGAVVMGVTVFGVILYFRTKKKGFIFDAPTHETSNTPIKDSILNPGILLTILIGVALCLFVILIPGGM